MQKVGASPAEPAALAGEAEMLPRGGGSRRRAVLSKALLGVAVSPRGGGGPGEEGL